jgi:hypothetical protein
MEKPRRKPILIEYGHGVVAMGAIQVAENRFFAPWVTNCCAQPQDARSSAKHTENGQGQHGRSNV